MNQIKVLSQMLSFLELLYDTKIYNDDNNKIFFTINTYYFEILMVKSECICKYSSCSDITDLKLLYTFNVGNNIYILFDITKALYRTIRLTHTNPPKLCLKNYE